MGDIFGGIGGIGGITLGKYSKYIMVYLFVVI